MTNARTEQRFLREAAYKDDRHLAKRRAIWSYRVPALDLPAFACDALALAGTETVLDAGCGPGTYMEALRNRGHRGSLIALDLSDGMAKAAAAHADAVVGDTCALPFCRRGR